MKFAAAAVFAAFGMSDAKRISSAQKKSNLLRKAVPVNKDGTSRHLNGEEYAISAYDIISFNDCLSLTWQNEDALDESLVEATAAGYITPQTSYAVFEVLNYNNAYYQAGSGNDLWMLPLADWVEATANTDAEDKENYCEACEKSYDYCFPEEDEEEEAEEDGEEDGEEDQEEDGEDDGEEDNDRKRKLRKRTNRKVTAKVIAHREAMSAIMDKKRFLNGQCSQYVNCWTCDNKGCFEDEDEDEDEDQNICDEDYFEVGSGCTFEEETVQEFMEEAACRATGIYYEGADGEGANDEDGNALELSAGLMCNSDGSGVEMAFFTDEDCSCYYSQQDFSSKMSESYLYALLGECEQTIMKPYINAIECMGCEYIELAENDDEDEEEDEDNDDGPEVSETCQNIMNEAVDVSTCGGAEREYQENQYDNYQNNQDEDGNYVPDAWYLYDFTDGEEPDGDDVCFYLQDLNGEYSSKHIYNSDSNNGGGNFFDYQKAKNSQNGNGGAGKTFGIVVAVVIVVVAGVMIMQNFSNKRDSKKVPLVGNNKGAMA